VREILLIPLSLLLSCSAPPVEPAWPRIAVASGIMHFDPAAEAALEVPLKDDRGYRTYSLECHTWVYGDRQSNPPFDYSGDFECRLTALYEWDSSNPSLLIEHSDAHTDWESRARFLRKQIEGSCGAYRDYGTSREFRLRGFRLNLEMRDVKFSENSNPDKHRVYSLQSFTFAYDVKPDDRARSAQAEPSQAPLPPTSCEPLFQESRSATQR